PYVSPPLFSPLTIPRPPTSTLFPYTTLFRSRLRTACRFRRHAVRAALAIPAHPALRQRNSRIRGDRVVPAKIHHQKNWRGSAPLDRKSTRLNSSHVAISYAVFCLKKKIRNNI